MFWTFPIAFHVPFIQIIMPYVLNVWRFSCLIEVGAQMYSYQFIILFSFSSDYICFRLPFQYLFPPPSDSFPLKKIL